MYSAVIHKVESTTKLLAHSVVFPTLWMSVLLATGGREARAERGEGGTPERHPGAQMRKDEKRERKRGSVSLTRGHLLSAVLPLPGHMGGGWCGGEPRPPFGFSMSVVHYPNVLGHLKCFAII
ncbi:unnamed protein product [Arctogadus glacialis]